MQKPSQDFLNLININQVKDEMNTIFIKVDIGIYLIHKDRLGSFSGRLYVSTNEVIDELNANMKVAILEKNQLGTMSVLHMN